MSDLLSTFIGFFLWYKGMVVDLIARAGKVQLLQPLLTLTGSYYVLNEQISFPAIVTSWLLMTTICTAQ
jgi:drug/metabolite transporter (DMT)-like permease